MVDEKALLEGKLKKLERLDSKVANALRERLERDLKALRQELNSIESLAEYEEKANTARRTIRKDAERVIEAMSKSD